MRAFVTVVSGVPRSGTSLLMQMLEAGGLPILRDDLRAPDEHNPRGYYEYAPVKATPRDAGWIAQAPGHAVKVVHALLPHLPAGPPLRVILLRRDLREVLASQRRMLAPAPEDLPEERVTAVFRAQLEEAIAWARARPATSLLEIEHASLLREPALAAARIDAFLDGGLDVAAMAACPDATLYRSRA